VERFKGSGLRIEEAHREDVAGGHPLGHGDPELPDHHRPGSRRRRVPRDLLDLDADEFGTEMFETSSDVSDLSAVRS
jgi:hypothetical protein